MALGQSGWVVIVENVFKSGVIIVLSKSVSHFEINQSDTKMKRSEHEVIAKRIINFYKNLANRNTSQTVQHFVAEGYLHNTISRVTRKEDYSLLPKACDSTEDMRKKWIKISQNNSRIHGNALMAGVRKKLRLVGK